MKGYSEQSYAIKVNNLDGMDKLLERHKLLKLLKICKIFR